MSNETQQEIWNVTHAQLLKSVADAQGKLLAAQNETNDRLTDLKVLIGQTQEAVRNSHGHLVGLIGSIPASLVITKPRRTVEKLRPKRIFQRPASKRKQRR